MESRFIYPGSAAASHLPPGAVYRTDDLHHPPGLLPYRELRANDAGRFLTGGAAASSYDDPQPPLGRSRAAPWWTTADLAQRPTGQRRHRLQRSEIISDEKLDERMSRYYDAEGLVVRDSAIAAVDSASTREGISTGTTKPQLWRKVCEPKMAILTEDADGRLVWKTIPEEKATTTAAAAESRSSFQENSSNRLPPQFKEYAFVSRTPFGY